MLGVSHSATAWYSRAKRGSRPWAALAARRPTFWRAVRRLPPLPCVQMRAGGTPLPRSSAARARASRGQPAGTAAAGTRRCWLQLQAARGERRDWAAIRSWSAALRPTTAVAAPRLATACAHACYLTQPLLNPQMLAAGHGQHTARNGAIPSRWEGLGRGPAIHHGCRGAPCGASAPARSFSKAMPVHCFALLMGRALHRLAGRRLGEKRHHPCELMGPGRGAANSHASRGARRHSCAQRGHPLGHPFAVCPRCQ